MRDDLNFHRDELDGRNQCPSEFQTRLPNGRYPRCHLEIDHTLDHCDQSYMWTDDEERKVVKVKKVLVLLWVLIGLQAALVGYGFWSYVNHPTSNVPDWYIYGALILLVNTVIISLIARANEKGK